MQQTISTGNGEVEEEEANVSLSHAKFFTFYKTQPNLHPQHIALSRSWNCSCDRQADDDP